MKAEERANIERAKSAIEAARTTEITADGYVSSSMMESFRGMILVQSIAAEIESAIQEEREACAKVADNADDLEGGDYGGPAACEYGCGGVIAAAIRKRGKE